MIKCIFRVNVSHIIQYQILLVEKYKAMKEIVGLGGVSIINTTDIDAQTVYIRV